MNKRYIKENLKKIRNSSDVNYIITTTHDKQMFIVAGLADGREIQLTLAEKSLTFPDKPMYNLTEVMGSLYMEDFVSVCEGFGCINRNNFASFTGRTSVNPKHIDLIATFKNGKSINLYSIKEKNFEKEKAYLEKKLAEDESDWTYYDDHSLFGL